MKRENQTNKRSKTLIKNVVELKKHLKMQYLIFWGEATFDLFELLIEKMFKKCTN